MVKEYRRFGILSCISVPEDVSHTILIEILNLAEDISVSRGAGILSFLDTV